MQIIFLDSFILCISERHSSLLPPPPHGVVFAQLHSTVLQSLQLPGMRQKKEHRNSDRDIRNLLDEEFTSQRQRFWNNTLAHKANSRQDTEEILATQGRRRPSIMRDMMSEWLLDCQGNSWKTSPPHPPSLFELAAIARASVFSDDPTY